MRGELYSFTRPKVMGIINVTPDSFYSASRSASAHEAAERAVAMLDAGADMIDLGGYSSRPGADEVSAEQEYARLADALEAIRKVAPEAIISIDTFRASVAEKCVLNYGADIINDISAGLLDPAMAETAACLQVPVVLMHMRGTPRDMQQQCHYENVAAETLSELAARIALFRRAGVADIIADPGFGFAKTVEQNYQLMNALPAFATLDCPLLVGISHKSMIYKPLGITPADALPGTIALNMVALMNGADILRVHDVAEAVQTVKIYDLLCLNSE